MFRDMLDPVEPACFHGRFPHAVEVLRLAAGSAFFKPARPRIPSTPATNVTIVLRHIGVV
jgi:hypothetical protein